MSLRIVVPHETADGETRVAQTPDAIKRWTSDGISFRIESGAGDAAGFPDEAYRDVGAEIAEGAARLYEDAHVVLRVTAPGPEEVEHLERGVVLACLLRPHANVGLIESLAERGVTALALELVPRITRAQSMDALSSQSNLAGYKAAVRAADTLGRIFPLLTTAAGTLSPARVLVLGAGVAGLQAIATAKRLGAATWGYDIRPA
ncbi:MAG: NAD(P)(+) transhydrogenase (Re/Si-specific) subunit alpha, partial [Gemmatimonadota bacterium]|nr:NAD(P)(+) transhydrogenase (Re/Si-specific) subunit alpha [Gemmatimonadota bacterium]